MSFRVSTICWISAVLLLAGCRTTGTGLPSSCPAASSEVKAQRHHLLKVNDAIGVELTALEGVTMSGRRYRYEDRSEIDELSYYLRELYRYCLSIEAFND